MTVADLITELQKLNPEAEIGVLIESDAPQCEFDIDRVDSVPEVMIVV